MPIDVPGGRIELRIDRRVSSETPTDAVLREWVTKAGRAVAAFYGWIVYAALRPYRGEGELAIGDVHV